jgi:hypothetical protein
MSRLPCSYAWRYVRTNWRSLTKKNNWKKTFTLSQKLFIIRSCPIHPTLPPSPFPTLSKVKTYGLKRELLLELAKTLPFNFQTVLFFSFLAYTWQKNNQKKPLQTHKKILYFPRHE